MNDYISENGSWNFDSTERHFYDDSLCQEIIHFLKENKIKKVCDLGCGNGRYSLEIQKNEIESFAYDGNPYVKNNYFNIERIDLADENSKIETCEWAICLEVGEHIPNKFFNNLIYNIDKCNTRGVIISWAIPGQDGIGHVNCRSNRYIKEIFKERGYINALDVEERFRKSSSLKWFKDTIMVFEKRCQEVNHIYPIDKYKKEIFEESWKSVDGFFTSQDVEAYREIVKDIKNGVIVEVGSFLGKSAISISESCRINNNLLICIDAWEKKMPNNSPFFNRQFKTNDDFFSEFLDNIRSVNKFPIKIIKDKSINAFLTLKKSAVYPDLIFLDTTHTYEDTLNEIKCMIDISKPGTIISGHDINSPRHGGVKKAVEEIFGKKYKVKGNIFWYQLSEEDIFKIKIKFFKEKGFLEQQIDDCIMLTRFGGDNYAMAHHFLEHYSDMGIKRFAILLTDSNQNNINNYFRIFKKHNIIPIWHSLEDYSDSSTLKKINEIKNKLLPSFKNNWILLSDMDEMLALKDIKESFSLWNRSGADSIKTIFYDKIHNSNNIVHIDEDSDLKKDFQKHYSITKDIMNCYDFKFIAIKKDIEIGTGNHIVYSKNIYEDKTCFINHYKFDKSNINKVFEKKYHPASKVGYENFLNSLNEEGFYHKNETDPVSLNFIQEYNSFEREDSVLIMVACGKGYVDQAKQVISSAHMNGWRGDYLVITDNDNDCEFFLERGIYSINGKDFSDILPLDDLYYAWPKSLLYKMSIFQLDSFKLWKNIYVIDTDVIVMANFKVDDLNEFSAVKERGMNIFLNSTMKEDPNIDSSLFYKYDRDEHTFNCGFYCFSWDGIDLSRKKILDIIKEYTIVSINADQLLTNLIFYRKWRNLSSNYNRYIYRNETPDLNDKILHFKGNQLNPNNIDSIYYKKWLEGFFFFEKVRNFVEREKIESFRENLKMEIRNIKSFQCLSERRESITYQSKRRL